MIIRHISRIFLMLILAGAALSACDPLTNPDELIDSQSPAHSVESDTLIFNLTDLSEEYGFNVAWSINDQGQIAGGNLFWDKEHGMINMGSIFARSLNNSGQVAGNSGDEAVLWSMSQKMKPLGKLDGDISAAFDINDHGEVVGEIMYEELIYEDDEFGDSYDYEFSGFFWRETEGIKKINNDGWADGINDLSQVVGTDYNIQKRAFIWDEQNHLRSLASQDHYSSARAYAINNHGKVAGSVLVLQSTATETTVNNSSDEDISGLQKIEKLLRVTNSSGIYDLVHIIEMVNDSAFNPDKLPWSQYDESIRYRTHNQISYREPDIQHQLLTSSQTTTFRSEAFIWDEDLGMTSLGTLGGDWSTAWDINDHGQIVGYSSVEQGKSRAFYWDSDNGMIELPTFGGNSLARSINNKGEIVGYSYDAEGHFYPVLWTIR